MIYILRHQVDSLLWFCNFILAFVINVGVLILVNCMRTSYWLWSSWHLYTSTEHSFQLSVCYKCKVCRYSGILVGDANCVKFFVINTLRLWCPSSLSDAYMLLLSCSLVGGKCKRHAVVIDRHTQLRWLSVVIRYIQHRHIWAQGNYVHAVWKELLIVLMYCSVTYSVL